MSNFFSAPQGAAVLKHGIIRSYAPPFVSKVGKWAPDQRVVLLDAYAGPGAYADGSPGSPQLMAATADRLAGLLQVEGIYVEKKPKLARQLEAGLADSAHEHLVICGSIDAYLDDIVQRAGAAPMFAFFDPFGVCVPFHQLVDVLTRGRRVRRIHGRIITEALVNLSYVALSRIGGLLRAELETERDRDNAKKSVDRLDAAMGPTSGESCCPGRASTVAGRGASPALARR